MDNTQSLEDMDDDIQLLETPTSKTTAGTNVSIDPNSTIGQCKGKNIREDDSPHVDGGDDKKSKSDVWMFFTKVGLVDGVQKCKCNHCGKLYTCRSTSGTNHLRRHVRGCFKTPKFHDVGALLDNKATLLKKYKFDSKAYRDALARCIIKHDLPFSYAEYEGVSEVNKILNPEFKPVSRNTAKNDCMKVFQTEKEKLRSSLASHHGRICLTSDVWTAVTTRGYMSVTAHYIDANWKLNSKLLSFCELDGPHSGLELSGKLLGVLKDWGIESKIFSLTLDNASSNNNMINILKDRLNLQNGLLCQGEFFHVKCCAHILNLIVQEGLKVVDDALKKIRNSVKYVKASDGRLREFQKCAEDVHLSNVGGSFLRSDVSTRWNSTYMMLESAIRYRRAFTSLSYNDTNYKHCPTNEEWERGERICSFLAPFYTITNLISGSSYPTSNLYFMQVATIEMKLNELMNSQDGVIRDMALRMKEKFDKYWDSYCTTLAFGCILDPKGKMKFLTFCYKRLYPYDYEQKVKIVRDSMYKLFGEYEQVGAASTSVEGCSQSSSFMSMTTPAQSILDEYNLELIQESSNQGKSELDLYLEERSTVGDTMDIIEYWKSNAHRFPRLAMMACDILSIPITTVASESTFSIGGRILHKYRNCLLPETVQALICTRNWLHGFGDSKDQEMQEVEEIQVVKEDSNVLEV